MTLEEQYILSIPGLVTFCSSNHANGLNVNLPLNGDDIGVWKNLTGDSNWDMKWWDCYGAPTQFSNTVSPKFKTNKWNGNSAIDLTQAFLVPNNFIDPISELSKEYTLIRIKQVNDVNKWDWDVGSATAQHGCTTDYATLQSTAETTSRNGIELYSGRLFPLFIENGALNHGISMSKMRWKNNDIEISGWFTDDKRYKYNNKTTDVPPPRLKRISLSSLGLGVPMIGGMWNRPAGINNQPYSVGANMVDAMLYYEFILFSRYLNDIEINQIQSYIKTKYNI